MPHLLLTGAGFSRNWGGWLASEAFEYLIGCPEILRNDHLQDLLWKCQPSGGFESALAIVQGDFKRDPQTHTKHLQDISNAVGRMFLDMNRGYFDHNDFEFQAEIASNVGTFLARFDAIFTLNQDLLLEHYYIDRETPMTSGRWEGSALPGMIPLHNPAVHNQNSWAERSWAPSPDKNYEWDIRYQPYFKLHGSSNWQETHGGPLLIMGGNKIFEIGLSPVLSWYHQVFEEQLSQPNARLMVIGYGFRDEHINQMLIRAIYHRGLKIFVIAPEGGDLARRINQTDKAAIRVKTELEESFQRGLIGASRRSMREIFGGDSIEFNKVMRFFE